MSFDGKTLRLAMADIYDVLAIDKVKRFFPAGTNVQPLVCSDTEVQKAIDQYKTVLRTDPENRDARDALRRLYTVTESWNALVEILRQELERTPTTEPAARAAILREIAGVYRDKVKNDAALVTVLLEEYAVQHP